MAKKWYWSTNLPKIQLKWRPETVSTPFYRRWFRNEKKYEEKELRRLYKRVCELYKDSGFSGCDIFTEIADQLVYPWYMQDAVFECLKNFLTVCDEVFEPVEPNWKDLTIESLAEHKNILYTQENFIGKKLKPILIQTLVDSFNAACPQEISGGFFRAPVYSLDSDIVRSVLYPFYRDVVIDNNLFLMLRTIVSDNIGQEPKAITIEAVDGTPLNELLRTMVPIEVPEDTFFSHMHVLGGSGSGKTSLLVQLMLHHFKTDATVIFIDSQGDTIPKLRTLESIQDRVVSIDPKKPPRLDIFKNATIETVSYLFTMLGTDLTGKQGIFFRMCAHLLMKIEHATLVDFLKMMDDLSPYESYLSELSEIQKNFFKKDFNSKNFAGTREQVKYRLQGILENRTIERLFTGNGKPLDIGNLMDSGKVILIDTSKEYLKSASPYFGRIFISCILNEVYARAKKKKHPTYLVIDECQEYMDSNIDEFLTQARKYKCGLVLAHQNLSQATAELRASLSANTAIKMVAGLSMSDARAMTPDMRTTPEYILSLPRLTFATYIRNITPNAIPFTVTPGLLDKEEHIELEDILDQLESEDAPKDEPQQVRTEPEPSSSQEAPQDHIDTSASENW